MLFLRNLRAPFLIGLCYTCKQSVTLSYMCAQRLVLYLHAGTRRQLPALSHSFLDLCRNYSGFFIPVFKKGIAVKMQRNTGELDQRKLSFHKYSQGLSKNEHSDSDYMLFEQQAKIQSFLSTANLFLSFFIAHLKTPSFWSTIKNINKRQLYK